MPALLALAAVALFVAHVRADDELQCAREAAALVHDECGKVRFVRATDEHASSCVAEIDGRCLKRRAALRACRQLLACSAFSDNYEIVDVDLNALKCIKRRTLVGDCNALYDEAARFFIAGLAVLRGWL